MLGAIPLINRWLADMAPRLPALAPHAVAWRDLAVVAQLLFHTPIIYRALPFGAIFLLLRQTYP